MEDVFQMPGSKILDSLVKGGLESFPSNEQSLIESVLENLVEESHDTRSSLGNYVFQLGKYSALPVIVANYAGVSSDPNTYIPGLILLDVAELGLLTVGPFLGWGIERVLNHRVRHANRVLSTYKEVASLAQEYLLYCGGYPDILNRDIMTQLKAEINDALDIYFAGNSEKFPFKIDPASGTLEYCKRGRFFMPRKVGCECETI